MNSQLSERIRQHSANFSKGQRMIARYIEEHSEQVAFMTASRLGQTVGVSESTVVRFATEIGYSGYPALQQAMQEMIRSKMTSVQRLERTSTTIPMDRLLDEVLDQDIDILKRTKENVDREAFYRAADALVNAKKVYVLGAGSSLALATFMAHYLRLVFETVHLVEGTPPPRRPPPWPSPTAPCRPWPSTPPTCCWPAAIWCPLWTLWWGP